MEKYCFAYCFEEGNEDGFKLFRNFLNEKYLGKGRFHSGGNYSNVVNQDMEDVSDGLKELEIEDFLLYDETFAFGARGEIPVRLSRAKAKNLGAKVSQILYTNFFDFRGSFSWDDCE